jgi:S-adenosylmethionine:tRNA ribosyltransferase-isomerase
MDLSLFDFDLPKSHIAQQPVLPRDSAKLLHVAPQQGLADYTIANLPQFLNKGDVVVVNNTQVIPARVTATHNAKDYLFTLHGFDWAAGTAWGLAKGTKKIKLGDTLYFGQSITAIVVQKDDQQGLQIRFAQPADEVLDFLEAQGHMPLPPYIERDAQGQAADNQHYQTVFAKEKGAVAAPTAGLHFTPQLMTAIKNMGVEVVEVTLHVGLGTFAPVKTDDITQHPMHTEWAHISAPTVAAIEKAKASGGRVLAVGTTALRVLESAALKTGQLQPFMGETNIFIYPGFEFKVVDRLLTNFHLPKSTLLMLVSAFCGLDTIKTAYNHAIKQNYRFYSYGDACLLERL